MESLFVSMLVLCVLVIFIIIVGKKYNGADWGHPATNILDGWLRLYCKKYHRQGNFQIPIPENKSLILVSNHLSAIDPFLIVSATNRPVRFMIAKEEYNRPVLYWMFKAAGCIPVDRGGRVEGAFRSALRAIRAGELVAIFPQGGIHSPTNPRPRIKPGIIKLSQLSGCSILPVRIHGIKSPGGMFKSIIERSNIHFDVNEIIEKEQVLSESFRAELSEWLINERDQLSA